MLTLPEVTSAVEASMQVWIPSGLLSMAVLSRSIVPGTTELLEPRGRHPAHHRSFPAPKRMSHEVQLREALADCRGDLELRFQGGQSIRVHSQKMALASSVFQALMDDVMGDQIAPESAKRRRIADEGGGAEPKLPSLLVGLMGSGSRLNSNLDFQVAAEGRV